MLYTELPSLPPWHSLFVNIRGLSKVKPQQLCITFSKTLAFGHPFLQALEMIRALFFLITTVYNDTQDLKKKKKKLWLLWMKQKEVPSVSSLCQHGAYFTPQKNCSRRLVGFTCP